MPATQTGSLTHHLHISLPANEKLFVILGKLCKLIMSREELSDP